MHILTDLKMQNSKLVCSPATTSVLLENGYSSLEEYLEELAEDNDLELEAVLALYDVLGENELFDGLVTAAEDMLY
jgi:hypothetical protein